MQITVVGLGKMGLNITKQMLDKGHQVNGFDINTSVRESFSHANLTYLDDLAVLKDASDKNLVLLLLPAGPITQGMIAQLAGTLKSGDTIVDFANAQYQVSIEAANQLAAVGIDYHDCGLSGGVHGARYGACMMLGGKETASKDLLALLSSLCVANGFQAYEGIGSGHYLKMVHNGIEYGMMQALAEGLELLKEQSHYQYDLAEVTGNWEFGSIIESALLSNIHAELAKDKELSSFTNQVAASGEAKWMIQEALEEEVAVPTIALSLMKRNASLKALSFSNQALSAMRYNFGGHKEF
ncbi:NADP-dependent phosphogluconate dehydrogenase [Aerococcus agrisoli]|uniref:NADP-dependent phosphogluconate dehydrogenase n=1 Tax=Aerococcus agrisoli TaxID=2487350 RepID=A0A3N4GS41_9LACT|nr:NADP-dependent phosphogluconate dehydrogenase [Aerococcus agrisoli]RPA65075.1 NADP-dependent phosphogluconate dehydrogenase [Aerococcus agrisoli]